MDAITHVVDDDTNKTRCALSIGGFQGGWIGGSIHREANCPRCNNEDVWEIDVSWEVSAVLHVPKSSYSTLDEEIAHIESGEFPLPQGNRVLDSIEVFEPIVILDLDDSESESGSDS